MPENAQGQHNKLRKTKLQVGNPHQCCIRIRVIWLSCMSILIQALDWCHCTPNPTHQQLLDIWVCYAHSSWSILQQQRLSRDMSQATGSHLSHLSFSDFSRLQFQLMLTLVTSLEAVYQTLHRSLRLQEKEVSSWGLMLYFHADIHSYLLLLLVGF